MRLIAEGFGEDDDTTNSELRSSAVESYLCIIGEPKLPSAFLQVICWVFGEYGTADGQHSGSYITGKLCDVVEAHSSDDTVKAYAVTALMKIYAFVTAAGRKVDVLPEYQSFIEELSASHSTDSQQRAYELQAVIGLDAHVVESIMPLDASCEDIQLCPTVIGKRGSEDERSGILNISSFRKQDHHEASTHSLWFEAYEIPKPTVPKPTVPMPSRAPPVSLASSTELVPIPEPSYPREMHQTTAVPSVSDTGPSELKLRLDGVQRKWGRPTYSSPAPSTPSSSLQRPMNVVTQPDGTGNLNSKPCDTSYGSRRSQVQIYSEKQKLAASLFGGPSKPEERPSSTGH